MAPRKKNIIPFNVIINSYSQKFESYDIMKYLINAWDYAKKHKYMKDTLPTDYTQLQEWIDKELKYQFWARCEYEMILMSWPAHEQDKGEKWDVYMQCKMNLPVITKLFYENMNFDF